MLVSPVKYCNSLNELICVLSMKAVPNFVTAAASFTLSSPSPFVSQLATQTALTLASAKMMSGLTIVPKLLQGAVVLYASNEPAGT